MWYKICSIESKTTYMKNTSIILAALTMICCSPASKEHQTKGIVCDATMNTISIVTANKDTLSFSTLDADKSHVTGLLLNDTAEIFYKGKYTAAMSATKHWEHYKQELTRGPYPQLLVLAFVIP